MQDVPYQLEEGLFLENSEILLPWFRSLNQISKRGGKPLPEKGKTTQLFWESENVFGGICASILAMEKGCGIFFLSPKNLGSFNSAQEEYKALSAALNKRFGEPHKLGEDEGYPWQRWVWGEVCVNLAIGERFMDYVALSVSKRVIANDL
jgi:hypothetical protein